MNASISIPKQNKDKTMINESIEITSEHYFTAADGVIGSMDDESTTATHPCPDILKNIYMCVIVLSNDMVVTGCSNLSSDDAKKRTIESLNEAVSSL